MLLWLIVPAITVLAVLLVSLYWASNPYYLLVLGCLAAVLLLWKWMFRRKLATFPNVEPTDIQLKTGIRFAYAYIAILVLSGLCFLAYMGLSWFNAWPLNSPFVATYLSLYFIHKECWALVMVQLRNRQL